MTKYRSGGGERLTERREREDQAGKGGAAKRKCEDGDLKGDERMMEMIGRCLGAASPLAAGE